MLLERILTLLYGSAPPSDGCHSPPRTVRVSDPCCGMITAAMRMMPLNPPFFPAAARWPSSRPLVATTFVSAVRQHTPGGAGEVDG